MPTILVFLDIPMCYLYLQLQWKISYILFYAFKSLFYNWARSYWFSPNLQHLSAIIWASHHFWYCSTKCLMPPWTILSPDSLVFFSILFIEFTDRGFFVSCLIWGLSNISVFNSFYLVFNRWSLNPLHGWQKILMI